MDFDDGWKDLANPTRPFLIQNGSYVSLSAAKKINGAQSYLQTVAYASTGDCLRTRVTPDLILSGDFWIEMWVNTIDQGHDTFTGGYNWLFSYGKFTASGVQGFCLHQLYPTFMVASGTGTAVLVKATTQSTNNAWHHYAIGRKNGRLYLFMDGKIVASVDYAGVVGYDEFLSIGGYYDNRNAGGAPYGGTQGYMDRLRVYNRCLTTENFTPLVS